MSIGNRIFLKKPEAPQELLDAFSTIPAANISDTMGRLVGMHPRIKLQSAPKNPINVGRALTIKTRSGDNLMLHKALNMAKPGDVIILSNDGGESYRSLIGEIMFTYLASRGAAGIIIDGPIRDIDAVRKMEMPISHLPVQVIQNSQLVKILREQNCRHVIPKILVIIVVH